MLNAPYNGGTHLPDITVVRPVWDEGGGRVLFFTAARGHHTDVGGLTPGSMPPDSRTIHDEGAYIDNWKLVDGGRFREAETRALLLGGRVSGAGAGDQPRRPAGAGGGLREGGAGARADGGAVRARRWCEAYMGHVQDNAEECVRRAIEALRDAEYVYPMDPDFDGRPREIRVQDHGRPGGAGGADRLHRDDGGAGDQLQRAGAGDAGGGALRVPLPRRRRHPDERGGDEAAGGGAAGGDDAVARAIRRR